MATFTISMSGSSVVNGSKSWTISDPDVQNLVNYLVANFKGAGLAPVTLTPAQALAAWAQAFVTKTVSDVKNYQLANAPVTPIAFT